MLLVARGVIVVMRGSIGVDRWLWGGNDGRFVTGMMVMMVGG